MNNLPAEQIANKALITQVLHEVLQEKPFLVPNACQCHLIDPHKLRMLLWKDKDTYILKIAEQKFVGIPRQDKRGEIYWKFRDLYESESKPVEKNPPTQSASPPKPEIEINQPLNSALPKTDRLAKFQERQAKTQQIQAQKEETKWINGNEVLAQLEKEKAQRKAQAQENALKEEIKENANNPDQPTS